MSESRAPLLLEPDAASETKREMKPLPSSSTSITMTLSGARALFNDDFFKSLSDLFNNILSEHGYIRDEFEKQFFIPLIAEMRTKVLDAKVEPENSDVYAVLSYIESLRKRALTHFSRATVTSNVRNDINILCHQMSSLTVRHIQSQHWEYFHTCLEKIKEERRLEEGRRSKQTWLTFKMVLLGLWTPLQFLLTCGNMCGCDCCDCRTCRVGQRSNNGSRTIYHSNFPKYRELKADRKLENGDWACCAPANSLHSIWGEKQRISMEQNTPNPHLTSPALQLMS